MGDPDDRPLGMLAHLEHRVLIAGGRGSHSSKPNQVRDWIAKWYPNERKLEMFARPYTEMWPKHDGWETWGNELPNDVAMTPNDPSSATAGTGDAERKGTQ